LLICHEFGWAENIDWLIVVVAVPTLAILQLLSNASKGTGASTWAIICEFVVPPTVVILAILLTSSADPLLVAIAYAAGFGLAGLICMLIPLRKYFHARLAKGLRKRRQGRAQTFAMIELSTFLNAQASMLLLPLLLTSADVGVFNLAFRIVSAIGLIVSSVNTVLIPRLATAKEKGSIDDWAKISREARIVLILGAAAFSLFIYLLGPSILLLAGDEFGTAILPMLIMGTFYCLGVALGPGGAILTVSKREKTYRNIVISISIISIPLIALATIVWGLTGAAAATGAAYFIQKAVLLFAESRPVQNSERSR
jgi:O-antigen/teichoic acid export membrane protein